MKITESISYAVEYICSNDNVSRECALCNMSRAALRVIAQERSIHEAAKVCFYTPRKKLDSKQPKWQVDAITDVIKSIGGNISSGASA